MTACSCPPRRAYGFTLIQHRGGCVYEPQGACTVCGHDVVLGEEDSHELCAAA
jgi:hypothetical protein